MTGPVPTGPTCPSCGVHVVAGYARCPKCKAALPYGTGRLPGGIGAGPGAGGTAVEDKRLPIVPLLVVGAAIAGGIAYFALRNRNAAAEVDQKAPPAVTAAAMPTTAESPAPVPSARPGSAAAPVAIAATPSPARAASALEASLRKARLWSTVEAVGNRLDIRSATCEDAQMIPTVDGARAQLAANGVGSVRCLERGGKVVFTRGLDQ